MQEYIAITTEREFHVEANSFEQATHRAGSVLTKEEELIILCDASKTMVDYTAGLVKARRDKHTIKT